MKKYTFRKCWDLLKKMINKNIYGDIAHELDDKPSFYCFESSIDAEKWGEDHYACWAKRYKEIMHIAADINRREVSYPFCTIEEYCGHVYKEINSYLRGNYQGDSEAMYKEMSHILIMLLCEAPRIPDNIVVYRLVSEKFMSELYRNNQSGLPTIEPGLMSTSMFESIVGSDEAYAQHKNILKIYIPKGTPGIYVNAVTQRSEYEVLLAPNRYLAMISYPYKSKCGKVITECKLLNTEGSM